MMLFFNLCIFSLLQTQTAYTASRIARRRKFSLGNTNNDGRVIDLKEAVQRHLSKTNQICSPYLPVHDRRESPAHLLSVCENVTFITDLIQGRGLNEYGAVGQTWLTAFTADLSEASSSIQRVTMTSKDVISIYWNVTFVPDGVISLVWLCRQLPGAKVSFFNVLHKEQIASSFSWSRLKSFLMRLFIRGVAELPHAVIVGKTELSFRELETEDLDLRAIPSSDCETFECLSESVHLGRSQMRWALTNSKEKLNLVRSIDTGILKNRKLATDLLQYLDAQRPLTVTMLDWNNFLLGRIDTKSIPGMGQFDIDGLNGK